MLSDIWSFLQNEANRAVLAWIGGGVAVVVGAVWAVFKFMLSKQTRENTGPPVVTAMFGGVAAGRDVSGVVNVGLNEQETAQRMAQAQRPLEEKLAALAYQVARDKGVEVVSLRAILFKLGEKGVRDEEIPAQLDKIADELITLRVKLARLQNGPPELASSARQTQELLDRGDFGLALGKLFEVMQKQHEDYENAKTIATAMQTEDQKLQIERWRILQETQDQIFSIQQDVVANGTATQDKAYSKWDKYIHGDLE